MHFNSPDAAAIGGRGEDLTEDDKARIITVLTDGAKELGLWEPEPWGDIIEDRGSPQFWYSGLFEMLPVRSEAQDEAAGRACVDFSMAELLRGGVTTCMEIGGMGAYVVERAAHYGLRVYMGLTFRSGRWLTRDGRRVTWEWDEEAGRQGLARAVQFFDKHDGAHGGQRA